MSVDRLLVDLEKEFKNAAESKDYTTVDNLFLAILPKTDETKYDEKLTTILHKLRDDKYITHKQMIQYRAKQVNYSIDLLKNAPPKPVKDSSDKGYDETM